MVLDMQVNDWLRGIFPPASIRDRVQGVVLRLFEPSFLRQRRRSTDATGAARQKLGDMGLRQITRSNVA